MGIGKHNLVLMQEPPRDQRRMALRQGGDTEVHHWEEGGLQAEAEGIRSADQQRIQGVAQERREGPWKTKGVLWEAGTGEQPLIWYLSGVTLCSSTNTFQNICSERKSIASSGTSSSTSTASSSKPALPSYWVPNLTPAADASKLKKPDKTIYCPMSGKPLKMKDMGSCEKVFRVFMPVGLGKNLL